MAVEAEWANSILEIGYERVLESDEREELVALVEQYVADAADAGIDVAQAKESLKNECLDIAPIIEPFPRVLKRVLRNLARG